MSLGWLYASQSCEICSTPRTLDVSAVLKGGPAPHIPPKAVVTFRPEVGKDHQKKAFDIICA